MKAITLTAPYGSLIAVAERYPDLGKQIETRNWSTRYRGRLLIHQARGLGPVSGKRGLIELIERKPFWGALREAFAVRLGDKIHYPGDAETIASELPLGAFVALARLVDSCSLTSKNGKAYYWNKAAHAWVRVSAQEAAFGDYSQGRYGFLLTDIRALPEPIPARGALGLWEYDGELPL